MTNTKESKHSNQASNWASIIAATLACLPWSVARIAGVHFSEPIVAALAGIAILGAAFLLSWAVETAEMDLPEALCVTVLALVAVLPEYAVDATFAWKAAEDPKAAGYAIANMTGGNRLLLGLGWSTLVFIAWAKFGKPWIKVPTSTRIDLAILGAASVYALVPVYRGSLTLVDTAVFVSLYIIYVTGALKASGSNECDSSEESKHCVVDDLVGPSALLGQFSDTPRRLALVVILVWSAAAIFLAAEPFAEALVHTGLQWGIDEFLLVQWVAPLASEAPEFAVASLLVFRGKITKGMLTLVSSKVNQWTLLVGTLPVVTTVAAGTPSELILDTRQSQEVLLTAAQSLFGFAILANLALSRWQAVALASLFIGQLLVPGTYGRTIFSYAYILAAFGIIAFHKPSRKGLIQSVSYLFRTLRA